MTSARESNSTIVRVASERSTVSRADEAFGIAAERSVVCLLLVFMGVVWLTTRRYLGIIHDAQLYAAQALNFLYPARFSEDLYFRFGSQDQYTLYSHLYAPLIAGLGLSRAAMIAAVSGQALWLGGLVYFARGLFKNDLIALLSICAAIALPSMYGMFLAYGEPFAT